MKSLWIDFEWTYSHAICNRAETVAVIKVWLKIYLLGMRITEVMKVAKATSKWANTCICTCTHPTCTYIYTWTHICVHIFTHMCPHAHLCVHAHIHLCACISIHMHVTCMHIHVYSYAYLCTDIYLHTHAHT